jgi:hypothetical protein
MGDEPLMGAIPLEDMDLVVSPNRQSVDVNPASPNIPMSLAKSLAGQCPPIRHPREIP